jgi:glycosyltransferase involved in cell wall biosynthesis
MEMLNIITRCTRTTKIREIFESINQNKNNFSVSWYVLFDLTSLMEIPSDILIFLQDKAKIRFYQSESADFGHQMINKTLDEIQEGLVYVLDDDNIIHPNFFHILDQWMQNIDSYDGLIFSQKVGGIDFTGLDIRESSIENVKVGKIDMAQFCLKRKLIGDTRIPKDRYVGDGLFIETIFENNTERFLFTSEIGCYYNYFKQVEIKDYFLPKVLVVGDEMKTQLKSKKYASYEDDRLKVEHIETDEKIDLILSSFKPDTIVTLGADWGMNKNISKLGLDFRKKWIHSEQMSTHIGESSYNCAMKSILEPFYENNPLISVFTPVYNTKDVLYRTYNSLKSQTYANWEWVIVNDSTDEGRTLKIAIDISKNDPRVRVYDFREKSGGIVGESKYRAASLCSGQYLLELDHDDILLPEALGLTVEAFQRYPDAKFVYSDCAEIDENHNSLTYGEYFAFGYGSYRDEVFNGKVYKAVNTQNINPKTIRHIVGVPNHIRAWDRFFYHSIGGHNRHLSIADDYELIVRSFLETKFVRIPKMLYLQFFHSSNTQNDSRADIQRRVRTISSYYNEKIKARFEELGVVDWAYEGNPTWPTNSPSRFGEEENAVNYIMELETDDSNYDTNKLGFSILN